MGYGLFPKKNQNLNLQHHPPSCVDVCLFRLVLSNSTRWYWSVEKNKKKNKMAENKMARVYAT